MREVQRSVTAERLRPREVVSRGGQYGNGAGVLSSAGTSSAIKQAARQPSFLLDHRLWCGRMRRPVNVVVCMRSQIDKGPGHHGPSGSRCRCSRSTGLLTSIAGPVARMLQAVCRLGSSVPSALERDRPVTNPAEHCARLGTEHDAFAVEREVHREDQWLSFGYDRDSGQGSHSKEREASISVKYFQPRPAIDLCHHVPECRRGRRSWLGPIVTNERTWNHRHGGKRRSLDRFENVLVFPLRTSRLVAHISTGPRE